ncbi:MAG: hypothetical protein OXC26_08370 [Albidovulum sp.]|nr:hypothetical protein [Albidovulum sp.]
MPQSEQPNPEHFLVASGSLIAEFDRQPAPAITGRQDLQEI